MRRLLVAVVLILGCDLLPKGDFEPSGTNFNLNSNITVKSIKSSKTGYNPTGPFTIDLICSSNSQNTETDKLPVGLFFLSENTKVQHLILIKEQQISAPVSKDTTIVIASYSVNKNKLVAGDTDRYQLGPVTDNSDLETIIDIVRNKNLNPTNYMLVQRAIYQVTDGDGLTSAMEDSLKALPDL